MNPIILAVISIIGLTVLIAAILTVIKPVTIIDWGKALLTVSAILFMLLVIGGALIVHYVHP